MKKPNFVLAGAPKCGTTSLYHYLRQHPDIFMPLQKDPRYFCFGGSPPAFDGPSDDTIYNPHIVWQLDKYEALFEPAVDQTAVGEASIRYFEEPVSAPRIHEYNPDMKILLILRDPADRAWSQYCWKRTAGVEKAANMREALDEELKGTRNTWYWGRYAHPGYYARHLKRFLEFFPMNQIHVELFDDLREEPVRVCQNYYQFLGVDESYQPDTVKVYNRSGQFSNPSAQKLWEQSIRLRDFIRPYIPRRLRHAAFVGLSKRMQKEKMPPDVRKELKAMFRDDVLELQGLIDRDLSAWLD